MATLIQEPTPPTSKDIDLAERASRSLSEGYIKADELPAIVRDMFLKILKETARGHILTVETLESDLTTTKAADYLNVSRPYLIKLLDEGKLPFHKVGGHRRVAFKDLKTYKERQRQRSMEIMAQLQEDAQDLDMGY